MPGRLRRRDVFLRIEPLAGYSPLAPIAGSRRYGRDAMRGPGHEIGRVRPEEITASTVDALVYREYLDDHYLTPNTAKIVAADVNEPPWHRRVPGAVLYAEPGERLRIHVHNADPHECHSLHVHGVQYGIDSDGAWPFGISDRLGRRSDEIRPGESWTYTFDVTEDTIGAWAFHDHVHMVQASVNRGLFGALIVRDPAAPQALDVPMFVHAMQSPATAETFESPTLRKATAKQTFTHTFTTPGTVAYHCKIHGPTMSGIVVVDAGAPAGDRAVEIRDNSFVPPSVSVRPGGKVVWTLAQNFDHIVIAPGGGAPTYCLNGRAFVGNTPTIEADAGQRLRWHVLNLDLGSMWHNFHPHAARWRLPAPPGGAADVRALSPAEGFTADTVVPPTVRLPQAIEALQDDPPEDACRVRIKGDFLFHCHLEEHMMGGLGGLVRSRDWAWVDPETARSPELRSLLDEDFPWVDLERGGGHHDHHDRLAEIGYWELLPVDSHVLAVHAVLMHTGQVLFFAGSGNSVPNFNARLVKSVVWDYKNGTFHDPGCPFDVFCAGQTVLADGKVLVAGGTDKYDDFVGSRMAYLFDPDLVQWIRVDDMDLQRWYPTLVSMGDGRAVAGSGISAPNEVFHPGHGWSKLPATTALPLYPHLLLLKDGRLFYTGEQLGNATVDARVIDPWTGAEQAVAGLRDKANRDQGNSILLPPAQAQRVMVIGGSGSHAATNHTDIIDLAGGPGGAKFQPGPDLAKARGLCNSVILPDRTVLITGGGLHGETRSDAVHLAEIYDPATNTIRSVAEAGVSRLYHSVALLLPDGRVVTAGSNPDRGDDELRLELYHPPYLFRGPRPLLDTAPDEWHYGTTVQISTPSAMTLRWAQLIRPMATTHSYDSSQRLVDLPIVDRDACSITVEVTGNPNLAPPGWYMLSVVDDSGIPSSALWVRLDRPPVPPPPAPPPDHHHGGRHSHRPAFDIPGQPSRDPSAG